MADIYVRKSGNDATGTGLTGAPYLTINKAYTVANAGDTILVGSGTYAEDSGSGYFNLNRTFATHILIIPEDNNLGLVTITGTSAAFDFLIAACSRFRFRNIVLRSHADTVTQLLRINNSNSSNWVFDTCRFEVIGKSGVTNVGIGTSWNTGTVVIDNARFINCEVVQIDRFGVAGGLLDRASATMTASNIQFINCKFNVGNFPLRLLGLSRFAIEGGEFISSDPTVSVTGLAIGVDGATGNDITGVISGIKTYTINGHAAIIGAGASDVQVLDSTFYGGENSGSGQGLVLKDCVGTRVARCQVFGGYLSTLYIKAAQRCLIEDSDFFNRYATSSALQINVNSEDGSKASGNIIRQNRFSAFNGSMFDWAGSAGDNGGNIVDQNVYDVQGSAVWGNVHGTTVTSLAAARAAHVGYDRPDNDRRSRDARLSLRHRGDRLAVL